MSEPTFADVTAAAERLAHLLPPTPMWNYPALDTHAGATVLIKHENVQPMGAFKVRGGLNLFFNLPEDERQAGVVTLSTGNHAQSIAYAARRADARCVIAMPEGTNPVKVRAVEALGGEVQLGGANLDEVMKRAEALAAERGMRLINPGNEPHLIAGVGTLYREVLTAEPDLDAIVVPVGSGSGAAAACVVAEGMDSDIEIIAVQSTKSPAGHDSWHAGELLERPNETDVEGLATGSGFALPQQIMHRRLNDFVLVTDEQIAHARQVFATYAHTLAEGAGAAGLAVVLADERFAGQHVAAICTGGNASPQEISSLAA